MNELSFIESFLATLDSRPTKLSAEHVEDPHTYPPRGAYILPKMARPMTKRQKLAPGQEQSLTVTLKSLRNPPLDIVLRSQSPLTSVLDLKETISIQVSVPTDKIKILHKKKPVGDAKVLKDIIEDQDTSVEFSVMIIGGTASIKRDDAIPSAEMGPSGVQLLETEEFWTDLKGFLMQRLKDRGDGERVFQFFENAWHETETTL